MPQYHMDIPSVLVQANEVTGEAVMDALAAKSISDDLKARFTTEVMDVIGNAVPKVDYTLPAIDTMKAVFDMFTKLQKGRASDDLQYRVCEIGKDALADMSKIYDVEKSYKAATRDGTGPRL